jgi:hypothetical protein
MSIQDGIRAVQRAFSNPDAPPRWPMYVRQAKQFLRNAVEGFDERAYGFASVVDLLRAAGKEGVLRLERDRQGAVRVFPGTNLAKAPASLSEEPVIDLDETVDVEVPPEAVTMAVDAEVAVAEPVLEPPIVDVEPIMETAADGQLADRPKRGGRSRKTAGARQPKAATSTKTSRPRARKSSRAKSDSAET